MNYLICFFFSLTEIHQWLSILSEDFLPAIQQSFYINLVGHRIFNFFADIGVTNLFLCMCVINLIFLKIGCHSSNFSYEIIPSHMWSNRIIQLIAIYGEGKILLKKLIFFPHGTFSNKSNKLLEAPKCNGYDSTILKLPRISNQ